MASTGSWMRSSGRRYLENDAAGQEFEEGDVWGLTEEINSSGGNSLATNTRQMRNSKSFSSNSSTQRMMIPRGATTNSAGKDIKKATSSTGSVKRSSDPLSIPERKSTMMMYENGSNSKHDDGGSWVNGRYGNSNYRNSFADSNNGYHHHDPFGHHTCAYGGHHQGSYYNCNGIYGDHGGEDEDEDEDNDLTVVPPHEFIARRLARRQISSFSVCEGVGRKLKGRDLSEVRNAVLRKTGFLER